MNQKPRVLVVEDSPMFWDAYHLCLDALAVVVIAPSSRAALRELKENADFVAVILDGQVPHFDNEPLQPGDTTEDLAFHIAEEYGISMYAASSDDLLNAKLVALGCQPTNKKTAGFAVADALKEMCVVQQ